MSALTIPVLIHLIQRERKRVVVFPSLMFLRRIPYQSVRRRSIRHWLLLLPARRGAAADRRGVRAAVLPAGRAGGPRRGRHARDRRAARPIGEHGLRRSLAAGARRPRTGRSTRSSGEDRATLVLFSRNAEENVRATSDRLRLNQAVDAAKVTSRSTRYGPALKLAQSILSASAQKRKEVVIVSDFQKTGWTGAEEVHLPEGTVLTPVSVAGASTSNVSIPVGRVRAHQLLRPGAPHRHRRHRQPRRKRRSTA